MEYKLTESQKQYLKGIMGVELPIFVQGKTSGELDFMGEAMYPLMRTHEHMYALDHIIGREGGVPESLKELLENPNDKIMYSQHDLPMELESHLTQYVTINVKSNEHGLFTMSSRIKTQDFSKNRTMKLYYNSIRLQAPKYNGFEEYEYLVYDQKNKLRKTEIVKVTSLPELEQAVDFTTTRKLMRKSYGTLMGKSLPYDDMVMVFEVMVDEIDLSNEEIGDYLEKIREIAVYADVFAVALVTV
ncbi:MAG: hypothetical protein ABS904_00765 [Solibacillus isronensis]